MNLPVQMELHIKFGRLDCGVNSLFDTSMGKIGDLISILKVCERESCPKDFEPNGSTSSVHYNY